MGKIHEVEMTIKKLKAPWIQSDDKLTNKIAGFTDIHYGRRNNDRQANQDNSDFIDWFIEEAKAFGANIVICTGDWHDNRNNINVSTMNYSLNDMEKLASNFDQFILIPGNHDLYFRDKRELNSVEFGRHIENMTIIREPTDIGNCAFMPWLVDDEWSLISEIKSKYMFGHFEVPNFYVNGMTKMPDNGKLKASHFKNQDLVFSGHFHKRQRSGNILYVGNVFPFDFSDAWDDERGAWFMEWDKEPEFKAWDSAPVYRTMRLSELLDNPDFYMLPTSYNRASIDVDITFEESQFLKDLFLYLYDARKVDFIPTHKEDDEIENDDNILHMSIDEIVVEGLRSVESTGVDVDKLIKLYESLK